MLTCKCFGTAKERFRERLDVIVTLAALTIDPSQLKFINLYSSEEMCKKTFSMFRKRNLMKAVDEILQSMIDFGNDRQLKPQKFSTLFQ